MAGNWLAPHLPAVLGHTVGQGHDQKALAMMYPVDDIGAVPI
jgi:hypothetical protein